MSQYQAGYKLRDLKAFLEKQMGERLAKCMTAEMGTVLLHLDPKDMGLGMNIMSQRYQAEFYFESIPFKQYAPAVLFANVAAWLMDNDKDRENDEDIGDPEIEVVLEDDDCAEITITIDFEEPVKVVEDQNGPIVWRGKKWSIKEYQINIAKKVNVEARRV